MKTLIKIFLLFVCLAPELVEGQVNTNTRQIRFYPVRAAGDTAAIAGNRGRMWYDFISNKFRGNVGGTNFTFGSGGGPSYIFGNGLIAAADSVVIDSAKVGLKSDLSGWLTGTLTDNVNIDGTYGITFGNTNRLSYFNVFVGSPNTTYIQMYPTLLSMRSQGNMIMEVQNGGYFQFTGSVGGVTSPIRISNPSRIGTYYQILGSDITASRNITLPLLTGNDTFTFQAHAQTLTNKTLGSGTAFSASPTINDGLKFTFNPNGTNAGLNFGAHTANPSSPVNGDAYYNSTTNQLFAYINGAWVALGSGGGFTNGAAANEFIKSNGTNGVASGIFSSTLGNLILGSSGTAGSQRYIQPDASGNADLYITAKTGVLGFNTRTDMSGSSFSISDGGQLSYSSRVTNTGISINGNSINFNRTTAVPSAPSNINGVSGDNVNNDGQDLTLQGGSAYSVSGNGNGGNLILVGGPENGSGTRGEVYVKYENENINLALFEPVQETGTSFTFDYSHLSKLVVTTSATAVNATVPVLQVGYITKVRQYGAGNITLTAGTNVVLQGKTSTTGAGDSIVIHAFITDSGDTIYACE